MTLTLTDILPRLNKVRQENGQYKALCPCHDDHHPSLSITEKDGKVLAKCFACGAQLPDILDALGFQREQPTGGQNRTTVQEAEYLYAGGSIKKVKYRKPDGSKFYSWKHLVDGRWEKGRAGISPGLYQSHTELPDIFFLVEGEKDVDNLKKADFAAVSLPDGSKSKWDDSYNAVFARKRVLILPDNDEPGQKYAQMCAGKLYGIAEAVYVLDLKRMWSGIPEKGDISDMIAHMGADAAIDKIMEMDGMQPWTPPQTEEATEEAKPGIVITSAVDLQNADLPPTVFLITGILPEGTSIISAASKIGKSWMVLDMGLCIAAGDPFMGKYTSKCGVLYLALEDSLSRLQDRMNKILGGRTPPAGFLFATEAPTLDNGLLENLDGILNQFPDTKLIIIDTLQKIRGRALPRESSYEQDYREMGAVKSHMDKKGVSVLFVHHNRKMKDEDDPFNMISGTNGIMGAADTIWAIIKGKRSDNEATLHITGRDVVQSDTVITFDKSTWRWKTIGSADWINAQQEKLAYDNDPIVKTIKELLKRDREWKGLSSELMNEGRKICKRPISASAQALGYSLRNLDGKLLEYDGIVHEKLNRSGAGSKHYFFYQSWTDAADAQDELPL